MQLSEETITLLGLAGDLALPVVLLFLGWGYTSHSARLEDRRARSRIATEWRLEVFRDLSMELNELRQFYTYVGEWKSMEPDAVIATKRRLDRLVRGNSFLWSEETLAAYDGFALVAFTEGRGRGTVMQLKANVEMHAERSDWTDDWRDRFVPPADRVSRRDFLEAHDSFLDAVVIDLGLLPKHR